MEKNKVRYMAIPVACGWAGVVFEINLITKVGAVRPKTVKPKK